MQLAPPCVDTCVCLYVALSSRHRSASRTPATTLLSACTNKNCERRGGAILEQSLLGQNISFSRPYVVVMQTALQRSPWKMESTTRKGAALLSCYGATPPWCARQAHCGSIKSPQKALVLGLYRQSSQGISLVSRRHCHRHRTWRSAHRAVLTLKKFCPRI